MIGPLKAFNSICDEERWAVEDFMHSVLFDGLPQSGYLAGKDRGGKYVQRLENKWAEAFRVRHAIACNSATSGIMAAAFAVELSAGDKFVVPPLTMSATVAAPMFTGAEPIFEDVKDDDFGLCAIDVATNPKAVFATNLFGHPASLDWLRRLCDRHRLYLIEDNAQSPFAMEYGEYAGTVGHIGVWSLNVHKPIQCGEGGIITTDDDELAERMRNFINHGEHRSDRIGLNLRMPEICAAIAQIQLVQGIDLVASRRTQAEKLVEAIGDIPGIRPPIVREGCTHVYYVIPFLIEHKRTEFCSAIREQGVPIVEGYTLVHRLPAFKKFTRELPIAEDLHDRRLFYFENTAYDLTDEQIGEIGQAFRKAAEMVL